MNEPSVVMRSSLDLLLAGGSMAGLSDAQLVARLTARDRAESVDLAARALLERHGPMVWGVS